MGVSSRGKTAVFKTVNGGSSPPTFVHGSCRAWVGVSGSCTGSALAKLGRKPSTPHKVGLGGLSDCCKI